jgi:hypothetical protein
MPVTVYSTNSKFFSSIHSVLPDMDHDNEISSMIGEEFLDYPRLLKKISDP